jgi:uncharacterized membrane protein
MRKQNLYKLILISIFAALTFVGCLIQIPLPSGGMIHLGNFVIIISALLCGGLIGGASGAIGAGLYDLLIYSSVDGMIKYFILKFIMGYIVGSTFRLLLKKKINSSLINIILGGILIIFTTLALILSLNGYISLSSKITNVKLYLILVSVFGYILSLILLISGIVSIKIKDIYKKSITAISLSISVNVVLEFILKIVFSMIIDSLPFEAAFVKGVSTMPACILTGTVTLYLGVLIFPLLFKATKNVSLLQDDIQLYLD